MHSVDSETAAELERMLLSERARAARKQATWELEVVELALARLADGSYGACRQCGAAIALARLLAQPSAAHCLACQQNIERRYQVEQE
ncbi:TraR/DksA C4-type zinc finger protein [Pseudoduganella aquatica]|nr:TraR/DksA C4-type zinc finger protein [Pseudoduganella aquatica]